MIAIDRSAHSALSPEIKVRQLEKMSEIFGW